MHVNVLYRNSESISSPYSMKDVLYFNIYFQRHTMGRLRTLQTLMATMHSMIVGSVQCCTWPALKIKSFSLAAPDV